MQFEKIIYGVAIIAFIIHFTVILCMTWGIISIGVYSRNGMVPNIMASIYTPFTIILLYEVYLLIYYLPHSITRYLCMQYEIAALIIIRGIFNNLSRLSVGTDELGKSNLTGLLIAFGLFLLILLLILLFHKLSNDSEANMKNQFYSSPQYYNYILIKRGISAILFGLFIGLFVQSVISGLTMDAPTISDVFRIIKELNQTFFSSFFSALILTEVLLLLFMYRISNSFYKMIRNSGFIISTILLKLSFRTDGLTFIYIILMAVAFGVATMGIYKLYERLHSDT